MKTVEEIIRQKPVYLHDWDEDEKIGVIGDFCDIYINKKEYEATECPIRNLEYWLEKKEKMKSAIERWSDINILFASYSYENYSGNAWVLFEKDGMLYEVNGSHCSCYGLEGQWEPEEVNLDELKNRLINGQMGSSYCGNEFKDELCDFLGINQ